MEFGIYALMLDICNLQLCLEFWNFPSWQLNLNGILKWCNLMSVKPRQTK